MSEWGRRLHTKGEGVAEGSCGGLVPKLLEAYVLILVQQREASTQRAVGRNGVFTAA